MQPIAIDLFCGLGGWTEGLIAEGYRVIGFDNERHVYGEERYPAQLVLQDVLTIHGRQFKNAALIVASPPCQAYSYRAMPWKRAKALPPPDNSLFEACFRIQREAIAAAGHFIPLVVENVRGAQPYVGRSKYHFGSFHLWGDVPALMPATRGREVLKAGVTHRGDGITNFHGTKNAGGSWFNVAHNTESGHAQNPVNGVKVGGMSWSHFGKPGYKAQAFNGTADKRLRDAEGVKVASESGRRTDVGNGARFTSRDCGVEADGIKQGGDWFGDPTSVSYKHGSKSPARKRASAMIAKIPEVLARHIARVYYPHAEK